MINFLAINLNNITMLTKKNFRQNMTFKQKQSYEYFKNLFKK